MLLCQFNPNDKTLEQAQRTTNDATGPRDLVHLLQRFQDLARSDPKPRSLLQWLRTAQELKLRYHPWIDDYVSARTVAGSPIVESAPKNRPKLQSVEAGQVAQGEPVPAVLRKQLRDALPTDDVERRKELLRQFRELDGKLRAEPGKKGRRGAMADLERASGIDSKNLGKMLKDAIAEKKTAEQWAQLHRR